MPDASRFRLKSRPLKSHNVREIGKGARIIWEYTIYDDVNGPTADSEKAVRLLEKISELDREHSALGKPVDIRSGSELAWNRKRAKRRFRRFYDEIQRKPLEIPDPQLGKLALKIIEKGDEPGLEDSDVDEVLSREFKPPGPCWTPTKRWEQLRCYEYRKRREPLLFFGMPKEMRGLLEEAQEAHRRGLFKSVIMLCRSVLEIAVGNLVGALREARIGASIARLPEECDLNEQLNALQEVLPPLKSRIDISHSIRLLGNEVVHQGRKVADDDAYEKLNETVEVGFCFLLWARQAFELAHKERQPELSRAPCE